MNRKELQDYYESEQFKSSCIYRGGDLGAVHTPDFTRFKLWSPLADRVFLNLYPNGQTERCVSAAMSRREKGVWEYELQGDCHGVYYDFIVEMDGRRQRTADPYARACGCNGTRSMVVDLRWTDPNGWENDAAPAKTKEQIICEVHVKDFSNDPSCGVPADWRGKYKAFTVKGTTLDRDGEHPTCLDYLNYLGVTHVQLMPVFDFASVDESAGFDMERACSGSEKTKTHSGNYADYGRNGYPGADENEDCSRNVETDESLDCADGDPDGAEKRESYNWGYDPMNFNVPEGSYSTDPFHGEVRIRELKELVMSLHQNGIRVVMDVVYNHTYSRDSWFERTVPGYYYRYKEDGSWSDGSACGNDFASEREMAADYILESVLYWAEEYHIDGFRFDLMGLLDAALMNRIRHALDEKFGPGEKILYGEPWRAGFSAMRKGSIPCLKENLCFLDEGIGVFCDATRDAVKGHVFEKRKPGFVNGGTGLEQEILCAVRAWTDRRENAAWRENAELIPKEDAEADLPKTEKEDADTKKQRISGAGTDEAVQKNTAGRFCAKSPAQIVNYVSAHDNLTLWDKLTATLKPGKPFQDYDEAVVRANKMAAAICYTCQGRLFFLAGEEAARTKCGDENSYQSSPAINQLDWRRMYDYRELMEYYRGLIAFRKQMPGLYDKSGKAGKRIFEETVPAPGCVSFCVDNSGHERWDTLAVWYNSTSKEQEFVLPSGRWELLIDGKDSWQWARLQGDAANCTEENSDCWRMVQIEKNRTAEGPGRGKGNQTGEISGRQRTVQMEENVCQDGKKVRTGPVSVTVLGRRAKE